MKSLPDLCRVYDTKFKKFGIMKKDKDCHIMLLYRFVWDDVLDFDELLEPKEIIEVIESGRIILFTDNSPRNRLFLELKYG